MTKSPKPSPPDIPSLDTESSGEQVVTALSISPTAQASLHSEEPAQAASVLADEPPTLVYLWPPILLLASLPGMTGEVGLIIATIALAMAAWSITLQFKFLLLNKRKRIVMAEVIALIGAPLLIVFAALLGDGNGVATYGGDPDVGVVTLLIILIISGLLVATIVTFGNLILVKTRFNQIARNIGFAVYVLLWILSVLVALGAYNLFMTLHDPNTE